MKVYELSKQKNIRDIGGFEGYESKTVKYGCFYRGGALHKVNEEDIAILKSMHITDIVDFRGEEEFVNAPDVKLEGVRYHNLPAIEERVAKQDKDDEDGNLIWFIRASVNGFEHMKKQYRNLINDKKSQDAYREFFRILMQDNASVYFHCSQGKDRAGLAAFFIEIALGVHFPDIEHDYLLSNAAMQEKMERLIFGVKSKSFYNQDYHQSLIDVFSAKVEYLYGAIEEMDQHYGGPLNYIKDVLGVDIDLFRAKYLE